MGMFFSKNLEILIEMADAASFQDLTRNFLANGFISIQSLFDDDPEGKSKHLISANMCLLDELQFQTPATFIFSLISKSSLTHSLQIGVAMDTGTPRLH